MSFLQRWPASSSRRLVPVVPKCGSWRTQCRGLLHPSLTQAQFNFDPPFCRSSSWYKQCTMSVGLDFDPRSLYPNLDSVLNSLEWQAYQDISSLFNHNILNHQPTAFSKRVESAYVRPKNAVLPAFIWQHRVTQCCRHLQRRYFLFSFFLHLR